MESGNSNKGQHRHRHRRGNRLEKKENHRQKRSLMALAKAQVGDRLWIAGYESKDGIERLLGMGLAPGMGIEVVQNLAGNFLIALGETRIGIDGGMAKRILVSDKPFDYLVEVQELSDGHISIKAKSYVEQ